MAGPLEGGARMTARAQQPRLMRGGLSGRIYVVTRYRDLGGGAVEALEKYDVTEDYNAIVETSGVTEPRRVGALGTERRCCRCGTVYTVSEHGTDTHCPDCLIKGMP